MATKEREWIYIAEGCLDARDITFQHIPDYVCVCGACEGNGKYQQYYCDVGSSGTKLTGPCDWCKANGFTYKDSFIPAPMSVTIQIAIANGLEVKRYEGFGLDWKRAA